MKKTLLAALIAATALVPATALAQDRGRWGGRDRSANTGTDTSQARPDRGSWRQQQQQQSQPTQQAQPQQRQWNGGNSWRQQREQQAAPQAQPQAQAPQAVQQQQRWGGNRGDRSQWNTGQRSQWSGNRSQWNGGTRPDAGQVQQQYQQQQVQRQQQYRRTDRNQYNRGSTGWNGTTRNWSGDRNRGSWNNNWRSNSRYDWRGYRGTNRNIFRLPRYYAPSSWGYGYRRFGIGFTLNSILYSQQYWINDPFYYRLPEVDGPYRWVRYYNDALLVDIYSGEVVDTIYDIFW